MKGVRQNLKEIITLSPCGHMPEQIQLSAVDYQMGTLERLIFLTGMLLCSCCFQAERFMRHCLAVFGLGQCLQKALASYNEKIVEAGYFTFYRRLISGYPGPHCSSLSFFFFVFSRLALVFARQSAKRKRLEMFYCTLQTHIPVTTKNVLRSSSLNLFLAKHW